MAESPSSSTSCLSEELQQQDEPITNSSKEARNIDNMQQRQIAMPPVGSSYNDLFSGIMQYRWRRPAAKENGMDFWKSYVNRYYFPGYMERTCLSKCSDPLHYGQDRGWRCLLCGSIPTKGTEVTFQDLPYHFLLRNYEGTSDRFKMTWWREYKAAPGLTVLEGEAINEIFAWAGNKGYSITREGMLRVGITEYPRQLYSWEFCVRRQVYFPDLPGRL